MCGLSGYWQGEPPSSMRDVATKMADKIAHRGPDDKGIWVDEDAGIALAHRRLAILDLSCAGHQPMMSASGRYVMVFNGEIYNHLDIREQLGKEWRGHSDTETLLAGFERWGIERTLKKTVGMFAIALWDREQKMLTLARDRMGEKPLYYGFQGKAFLFGSEMKSLKVHPEFAGEIDRDVICLYLRHCYIPAPYSIYKGIKKLPQGSYLQLPLGTDAAYTASPKSYWSMADVISHAVPFQGSDADAIAALDSQLRQSVGLQMMADVPLGAFLSGGVDSSTVVALMQAQSDRPVQSFSIGFEEPGYDEAHYAKAVARHLGTEHTELYVSSAEAMALIPRLGQIYDEPFADSSQIPTFLVSQMAKAHVTVSLSGDGGDELFGGYHRYLLAGAWGGIEKLPFGLRKIIGGGINSVSPASWNCLFRQIGRIKPLPAHMGDKFFRLASRLQTVDGIGELYYSLISEIDNPDAAVIGANQPASWLSETGMKSDFKDARAHMMYMDAMTYLPDDILVKVDRAAMANGLETRVPLLDHRLVEFACRLPMDMKIRDGTGKWILRQVLYQYVPHQLIERPKAGFSIPLANWLRGPLHDWAEALLAEARLLQEGYFNAGHVRGKWQEHLSGSCNHQYFLWNVLMFQLWLETH